jgi:hypothetical protein
MAINEFDGYEDLDTLSGSKDTNIEALHFEHSS